MLITEIPVVKSSSGSASSRQSIDVADLARAKDELCRHLELESGYQCYLCQKEYPLICTLFLHLKVKHPGQDPLHCFRCTFTASNRRCFKSHLIAMHSRKYVFVKCVYCPTFFNDTGQLRDHLVTSHQPWPDFVCDICGHCFEDSQQVANQIEEQHASVRESHRLLDKITAANNELATCTFCEASFLQASHLLGHLRLGHRSEALPCWICDQRLPNDLGLQEHLVTEHGGRAANSISNGVDLESLPTAKSFTVQKRKSPADCFSCADCHNSEYPVRCIHGGFVCLEFNCSAFFSTRTLLVRHKNQVHQDLKPIDNFLPHFRTEFKCSVCNTVIFGRIDFKVHLDQHDALSKLLFKRATGLKSAKVTNKTPSMSLTTYSVSDESYPAWHCEVAGCRRVLLTKAAWLAHKRSHEGSRDVLDFRQLSVREQRAKIVRQMEMAFGYPCSACDLKLETFKQFTQHVVARHPDVQPLTCSLCRSEEKSSADLKWHFIKMHYLDCPLPRCVVCPQLFSTKVRIFCEK